MTILSRRVVDPAVGHLAGRLRYYSVLAVAWIYTLGWLALTFSIVFGRVQSLSWYLQIGALFLIVLLAPPFDRLFRGYDRYREAWATNHVDKSNSIANDDH